MSERPAESPAPSGAGRARYVRGMFGDIAARYDLLNTLMSLGRHHAWRRMATRALVRPGDRVLDAGCGTGDLSLACAAAGAASVLGIDFAPPMLGHAREKAARAGARRVHFALADATLLPLPDGAFDVWCAAFVVRNIPELDRALEEAYRVLRPGGLIGVLEMPRPESGWLRPLLRLHFERLVPLLGRLVSGHGSAYSYLPLSVDRFLTTEGLSEALRNAGFELRSVRRMMLGTVALHVAERPERAAKA